MAKFTPGELETLKTMLDVVCDRLGREHPELSEETRAKLTWARYLTEEAGAILAGLLDDPAGVSEYRELKHDHRQT